MVIIKFYAMLIISVTLPHLMDASEERKYLSKLSHLIKGFSKEMSHHITSNAKLQENKELLHALHDSCKNDCRRDTSSVQKNQQTTSYKFIPKITDIMNSDVVSFFIDFLAVVGAILTVWEYAETRPYKDPQVLIE